VTRITILKVYKNVWKVILKEIKTFSKVDPEKSINIRIDKFCAMGIFKFSKKPCKGRAFLRI
jgi:hypothetical protein|tara:strand:+ start:1943 stop:2128 length:186 start_codon:yes stop_codon:yes gene_type:complete